MGGVALRGTSSRLAVGDEWRGTVQDKSSVAWGEMMVPSVKQVIPGNDFVLTVVFDNGESGSLDMKGILDFGVFTRIRDPKVFEQVRVSFDTIAWDCGVDLDPEYVYAKCMGNVDSTAP